MSNTSRGFFPGLIIGAIVGAGIAIILIPRPGEKVKQGLRSGLDELGSRAREAFRGAVEEGRKAAAEREAELKARFEEKKE